MINETRRVRKSIRDGVPLLKGVESRPITPATHPVMQKHKPIKLTEVVIDDALVKLCSRGPSFVPTQITLDWNDVQQGGLDFKRKVRWRA